MVVDSSEVGKRSCCKSADQPENNYYPEIGQFDLSIHQISLSSGSGRFPTSVSCQKKTILDPKNRDFIKKGLFY